MSRGFRAANFIGLCACVVGRVAAGQPFTIEPIASPGQPVPGIPGSTFVTAGSVPQIDNSGRVLFVGTWQDGPTLRGSLFYGDAGGLIPVQTYLDPAPDFPGSGQLIQGWSHRLSKTGILAVRTNIGPSQVTVNEGLYVGPPSSLELAAYTGGPAPGAPGHTILGMIAPLVNSSGQVAFFGTNHDAGAPPNVNYQAITAGPPDALSIIAGAGGPVGPIPGATFVNSSLGNGGFNLNDQSAVGFYARFTGRGVTPANDFALFTWAGGQTQVVAREASPAPSMAPGVTFAGFQIGPGISNMGAVEFIGAVQGPGIDPSNNDAVWAGLPQNLRPAIREGATTPGLERGVQAGVFGSSAINDADRLVVEGYLRGAAISTGNDQALWFGAIDSPGVVLREGEHAYALPDSVVFAFEDTGQAGVPYARYALDNGDDLLVLAGLAGPGISPANNVGVWFREGQTSAWSLVLRTGQTFDGRTIAPFNITNPSITFVTGGGSGYSQSMLDDGTFVMAVRFTEGGGGVYRFSVPEPSMAALVSMSGAVLGWRRRGRRSPQPAPRGRATDVEWTLFE